MITIIPKPTDIPSDNSTSQVMSELDKMGESYRTVFLEAIDPFSSGLEGEDYLGLWYQAEWSQF